MTRFTDRITRIAIIALFSAVGLGTACSGKSKKSTEQTDEVKETPSADQTAQSDARVIPPLQPLELVEQAPAAEQTEKQGDTTAYQIGDLVLLHKRTKANPVVQARVYIRGGAANLTEKTAGIERLALQVATTGGTESTPKDTFNSRLDATGASVFSFADRSYSGYGLKTLADHFDENWELLTQAVLEPAMPQEEVAIRRSKQLAAIASMLENPDSHVQYAVTQKMFEGHPFENLQIGTKENVESFTRDELLAYQRSLLVPARILVVVVGNVDASDVAEKVRASFGRLKPRAAQKIEFPPVQSEPGIVFETRQLPTNYILGLFPGPRPGHADYPATLVAMDFLRERLFEEVRTKRNLTYAVSSGISDNPTNYGYLYVTAADPPATLPVIFDEVAKLKSTAIDKEQLDQTKNVFITKHFMDLQTNGSQASQLAQGHLIAGDWKSVDALLEKIRAVTPADVQRVVQTYMKDYRFAVVGPNDDLDPALFTDEAAEKQ